MNNSDKTKNYIMKYGTIAGLVILMIFFSISTDRFLQQRNLLNIMRQISMLTIVASGLTIAMATGEFDLSVGEVAGLGGIVTTFLLVNGYNVVIAILAGLFSGLTIGFLNGIIVSVIGVPSLIVTLATSSIALGFNFMITKGKAIYGGLPNIYTFLGQGVILGIPTPILIMLIIWFLFYILLNKSKTGRYLYAIGGNFMAAKLSGINIKKNRILSLTISGGSAAFAGLLLAARLGSGQPTAGSSFLMDGLGSVFIGMTVFSPGKANLRGTIIGALIFGVLSNGLNMLGTPYYIQNITKGIVMVAAVSMAVYYRDEPLF